MTGEMRQEMAGGRRPILGLAEDAGRRAEVGGVYEQTEPAELLELTVIVPARNEEECLEECLASLVAQSDDFFLLGGDWELVVVDDHSTDRTAEIASGFVGVTVLQAGELPKGWTGKANAIWTAARKARGRWLLFTDADTVHELGNLLRAIHEAERHKVGMLSYSPRQRVSGLAQRTLMPLIFSELAVQYPASRVSDPAQKIAAANGQFLLVEREVYRRLGGHASVAGKVLEDVELAALAKRRKVGLRFRYAEDAVSARMYRSTAAMLEGWTKNLALLFENTLVLVVQRKLEMLLLWLLPGVIAWVWWSGMWGHSIMWLCATWAMGLVWVRMVFRFYRRVAKSNFGWVDCLMAPLGMPLYVWVLFLSWFQHRFLKRVSWKGRSYAG